jgi:uncharacterized repeat protein (TIGR01451 family)
MSVEQIRSEAVRQFTRFARRRILVLSALTSFAAIGILGVATAYSACVGMSYSVTTASTPPTMNWTNTSGNWQPAGTYPGQTSSCDTASDTNALPTVITLDTNVTIAQLNLSCSVSGCELDIPTGTSLTLAGASSIGSGSTLKLNGGTLTIASGGSLTFNSGSSFLLNSGTVDVQTGGALTVNGPNTVSGTMQLSGGTLTVPATASLTFIGGSQLLLGGGAINGGGTITSSGLVQQNGATTSVSAALNNDPGGSVNVVSGTLSLLAGGTGKAPFTISAGGTLDFPSGSYVMTSGGTVSGGGTLSVTGGTLSIGGVTSPSGFVLTAGTLTGPGFLATDSLTWSGGTMMCGGPCGGTQLNGIGTGTIDGAVGPMTLDGRTFNDYGSISYTPLSGGNQLTLANGATFGVFGTFNITSDGSINTSGTAPLLLISPNGQLVKSGGTGTSTIFTQSENDSSVFVQSGTLNFAGNGSHSGTFSAAPGSTLVFSATSSTLANGFIGIGGTLSFPTGSSDISDTMIVDGLTSITGGDVTINNPASTQNFTMTSGTLHLFGQFDVNAPGVWSGGTIKGTNVFHITCCAASLTINGANGNTTLGAVELFNEGLVTYTSPSPYALHVQGSLITNAGTFDIKTDQPIVQDVLINNVRPGTRSTTPAPLRRRSVGRTANAGVLAVSGPLIDNQGTFEKSAGSGTTNIGPPFTNSGGTTSALSGIMGFSSYTQSSGTTTLGPGGISVATPMAINGGTLNGAGTITGNVNNSGGNVSPGSSPGTIAITGNYTQGSAGSMLIELAGTSAGQFDRINVTGTVTLAGTLNVTLLSFTPANGNTWAPLTFASRTGDFTTKNLPTFAGTHGSIVATYIPPTQLTLTAVVTPQSTDLSAAVNGPASVNAGAPLSYTITITNGGPDPTSGTTTVSNTLPAGVSAATGSGSGWSCGAPSGGVITCTSTAAIASAGTFPTLTMSMTAPSNGGSVTDSATVSSPNDSNGANNTASASTTVVPQADVSIVKNGPGGVTAGQNVVYTTVVTNNGPSTATGVVVTDPTPANLTFVSNAGACTTAFPCSLGTMTNGQTATITSTYSTSPSFSGNVTNTATVSANEADPNSTNNSSSKITNVGAQADLKITKTGPATANTGQNITYTVTVNNQGPSPATNVVVTDVTPTGLAFISNSGGCTTAYPCNLGTVSAAQTVTITSTYSIPSNFAGTSTTNTASVSSSINDPNTADNTSSATTAVGPQTDLSITKSGPTIATAGQNIVYTLIVTNGGGTAAPNVTVADPTPAGLTFVSNSGACATAFPCNVGTLNANQSASITATFNIPANFSGTTVTNTATVSSSIGDPNNANNTAAFTTTVIPPNTGGQGADLSVTKSSPNGTQVNPGQTITFNIDTFNSGPIAAASVIVNDPTPAGLAFVSNSGACATPFPCNIGTIASGQFKRITATYTVTATVGATITNVATAASSTPDPNNTNNTGSTQVSVVAPGTPCNNPPPLPIAPGNGAVVASPVAFSWSPSSGASSYVVAITGGGITPLNLTTSGTTISVSLPNGSFLWSVTAVFSNNNCPAATSQAVAFTICTPPAAPLASVVGESTSGQTYAVQWPEISGAAGYELQESTEPTFANPVSTILTATSKSFLKTASVATPMFYRVRALACDKAGAFSQIISVVVVPLPGPKDKNIDVNVPAGSTTPVVFTIFIPGLSGPASFVATTDKPWLAVVPTNGIVPPEGINLTLSVDPTGMINGTFTGTVIVAYGTPAAASGRAHTEVTQVKSIPISISLVTPVTPAPLSAAAGALVVPSAGHVGAASPWQSDIRVANVSPSLQKYQVTFNDGTAAQNASVKQTIVSIDGGATMALDDIVRNWFGVGSLGDAANGILLIQQLDGNGKVNTTDAITKNTVVTSRTYNVSSTTAGTLGQFVPAIPFANFLANSGAAASLQQLAQSADYRTNLGIAEAAGKSANVNLNAFDALGKQLFSLPLTINAGESKQLNAFFTQNGVSSLSNGRVEVKVSGGEGRVTAYASVIDNASNDPFLVPPVTLSAAGANRYVIAGVGDITSPAASWRSDLRVFNAGSGPQTTTLTFYPLGNPAAAVSTDVSIVPGEVKALDNLVQSLFGMTNVSGSLHVTTASNSPLVVTSRTFDQTTNGTLGQFITAVTAADAVGAGDRSLQVLQAEDSPRYRTNVGIVEVSGKPATAEITVVLPDSKVSPKLTVPLAAFEARQIPVLSSLGLGNVYNARISVKVTDGSGKITAYGSVLDMTTQAPTYIPAQ